MKCDKKMIDIAILVLQRINFDSAYGRDVKLCVATNEVLKALRQLKEKYD